MINALMVDNLGYYFLKNVFNFLTSKVDNFVLLHSKDFFGPTLTCICPYNNLIYDILKQK
jgi:hypothetical protein